MLFNLPLKALLFISVFISIQYGLLAQNPPVAFSFSMKKAGISSAGVYKRSGNILVRTLWNNVSYPAGTHTAYWDRVNDDGLLLDDTGYYIKVISNNLTYKWEGVIGNNSDSISGKSKIRAFDRFHSLAFAGQYGYYAVGYTEGVPSCYKFDIHKPNNKINLLEGPHKDIDLQCDYVTTDGSNVYWAGYDPYDANLSMVFTTKTLDDKEFLHSSGTPQPTKLGRTYASAIDLYTNNPNAHPSGLAVQKNGSFLFVAHRALNQINVLNKTTGAQVQTLSFTAPREICVDPSGNLWVISGTNTIQKFAINSNGTLGSTLLSITGIAEPLAMEFSPNGSKLFILDGAASQQVKIFSNTTGSSISTMGSAGGYINNASVNDYKFYFSDSVTELSKPFIAFQTDSSFWLGDVGNERVQHYNASGTFLNRIMCLPHSYSTVVDRNNPNRVFNEFLEFNVDYSKPLGPHNGSWTLVNNWRRGIKANYFQGDKLRIFIQLITLSNNRTYALLDEYVNGIRKPEVVELITNGKIRYTGIKLQDFANDIIGQDGSLRRIVCSRNLGDSGYWEEQALGGFDNSGNPYWNKAQKIASLPRITSKDPAYLQISSPVVTSGNYNIIFNGNKNKQGYHLGAVKTGSNSYSWKTANSTQSNYSGEMPDDGTFDIGNNVEYAGGNVYTIDNQLFWNYHGEFWKNSQTNIWNHYHESGLMLGQFGVVSPEAEALEDEAFAKGAGNVFSSTLVKVGSDYYIYHNDESVHGGIHRWKISGMSSITEQNIAIQLQKIKYGTLKGRIFSSSNLDPVHLIYETIDSLGLSINERGKSSRWTGYLKTDSGLYRFRTAIKGGFRLSLNGALIADYWQNKNAIIIESEPIALQGNVSIEVETQSMPVILEWSNGNGYTRVTSNRFIAGEFSHDHTIKLMEGIKAGHIFRDSLFGWQTTPSGIDTGSWLIETGIKSANNKPTDICMHFLSSDKRFSLTRSLNGLKPCLAGWQIKGEVNLELNSPTTRKGGTEIQVTDQKGKTLCTIRNTYLPYPEFNYPSSISINGSPVFNESLSKTRSFMGRFIPFTIEFKESGIVFYFGKYMPVHVPYDNQDANWLQPGEFNINFIGEEPKTMHQLSIRSLVISGNSRLYLQGQLRDTICEGEKLNLGTSELSKYQWSNGSRQISTSIDRSGWYFIKGTDKDQCSVSSDSFNLSVMALPLVMISKKGDTLSSNYSKGNNWKHMGATINTSSNCIAKQKGWYYCEVINDNNCMGIDSILIETLEIATFTLNRNSLYPNPSNGTFTINCKTSSRISIFNQLGICILNKEIQEGINTIELKEPGVYLIKTENSKETECIQLVNY